MANCGGSTSSRPNGEPDQVSLEDKGKAKNCECKTEDAVVYSIPGANIHAIVVVKSECKTGNLNIPGDNSGPSQPAKRREEGQAEILLVSDLEQELLAGRTQVCAVVYTINNLAAPGRPVNITEFQAGNNIFPFQPPIAPGQKQTVSVATKKGECEPKKVGILKGQVGAGGGPGAPVVQVQMNTIDICVLV